MKSPVLFDLDETLFNRAASVRAFVEHQFSGRDLGPFATLEALCDRFVALDARGSVAKTIVYRTIMQEMGWDDDGRVLFDEYEANAWRHAFAFDGMRELLLWLRDDGRKVGIISNGQTHIQLRTLLALNLDRLVDTYLISETEACKKPDPEIFHRAARRLAVDPRDCIFVGDSPHADMAGARAAHMRTVWFPNGLSWPDDFDWQPDAIVSSLGDVCKVVQKLDRETPAQRFSALSI
ncbi:hydrolase [Citreicella sp. SE45]|nr:hydrolase [Citreicella sp. SE45]